MGSRIAVLLLVTFLVSACGVTLRAGRPTTTPEGALVVSEERTRRCAHHGRGEMDPYRESLPEAVSDPELAHYLERFDSNMRRTAVAAGIEPLLARLVRERERVAAEPTRESLEMRQELAERIDSLPLQLFSVEFECECNVGLLQRAIDENDESERSRQLSLTILSLVTGAAVELAGGIWALANEETATPIAPAGPEVTEIIGAIVMAGIGATVLVPQPHEIVSVHERNVLAPIVTAVDDERLLPTFVFRMLTLPEPDGEPTPREVLLARWDDAWDDLVPRDQRALAESIVYGEGGVYDPRLAELRRRLLEELDSMLDSLEPRVALLSQAITLELEGELRQTPEEDDREGDADQD